MLNKIVNAVQLIACTCVIVSAYFYVANAVRIRNALAHEPRIDVGQTLTVPRAARKPTLVMELSPNCKYCLASEPLYRRLSSLPKIRDGRVQIVVAMPTQSREEARDFVRRDQIPGELITGRSFPFPFVSTPTILLLDESGKVLKIWRGKMQDDEEQAFVSTLSE